MPNRLLRLAASAAGALALVLLLPPLAPAQQDRGELNEERIGQLEFRNIGPAVTGGRIHDVEALPDDPSTVYVATATGGLWRSHNGGTTWDALFQHQPVSNFGDIDIAPTDSDVIYAGTGGQQNRQSTSWGNGVYRSVDAGSSWTHMGLVETRHIAEVEVHPEDPDVAWVAAQGNLWAPSEERGVYKTTDGGETWQKVLHVDTLTGANDLAVDPQNPNVIYASTYQRLRRTWGFNGGG
ncbi:MAG: WD40/YVTN/BNR-like repeat-containing protein, partial [Gemmatimonadota bacterium]